MWQSEKLQFVLALLGLSLVLYVFYRSLDFAFFHFITPSNPLRVYQRPRSQRTYALITGGNGGIGYGIALSLVHRGFSVILVGRDGAKLAAAGDRLRKASVLRTCKNTAFQAMGTSSANLKDLVQIIVLDPRTTTPTDIERSIQRLIMEKGLQVSILVNNVGSLPIAYPPYRELATYSPKDIDDTMNLNARFMVHLTTQMLPILAEACREESLGIEQRGRSLILNLSSGAKIGLPYQVLYAATKSFNSTLSIGLSRELTVDPKTRHIDVLSVLAGDVKSQGNIAGLLDGSPDSEEYGRYIVERSDGAVRRGLKEMTPYWRHHLNFILLSVTPEWLVDKGTIDILSSKRTAMNKALKSRGALE